MGFVVRVIDSLLFAFFLATTIFAVILDAPKLISPDYIPKIILDASAWYEANSGGYLMAERPPFFVGLMYSELFYFMPLAVANMFAIVSGKSWLGTTCVIFGASYFGGMMAVMGELFGSGRPETGRMLKIYSPLLGLAVLAVVRGLLPKSPSPVSTKSKTA